MTYNSLSIRQYAYKFIMLKYSTKGGDHEQTGVIVSFNSDHIVFRITGTNLKRKITFDRIKEVGMP